MGAVTNYGARLISLAAILGAAVSIYNYITPLSGIDGTPGAIVVIVSTLILFLFGLVMGLPLRNAACRSSLVVLTLLGIAGTAFAAYLLNSMALLALMALCFLGLLIYLFTPRAAYA